MIKVKINNEYKDVVKIFCGGTLQKEIIKVWSREAQEYVYESSVEYTGSLPITITADGNALLDYRIYGADGGVGVATDSGEPAGYKLPMTVSVNYEYVFTGSESFSDSYGRYQFSLPKAAIKKSNASNTSCSHFPYGTGFSNSGTFSFETGKYAYFGVRNEYPTIPDFKQFLTDQYNAGTPMRLKYFLAPSDVPVYIGENQLDAIGEYRDYVDFGIQKIARKIREYTFTGNETFNLFAQNAYGTCWVNLRLYTTVAYCPIHQTTLRSSHFTAINNSDADFWYGYPQLDDACNFEKEDGYDTVKIFFRSTANFSTAEECKAYFKEQYDNGTPVKIWFVMKYTVGQYESTDNGKEDPPVSLPDIPTIDGTTVIDYDGTPKPSQMYVKYRR